MTIEELLQTRYIVIAPYPDSYYAVGEKLITNNQGFKLNQHKNVTEEYLDGFPKLFRKMPWWEGLRREDLPTYIKFEHGGVEKVDSYINHILNDSMWTICNNPQPATEGEYNAFVNSQSNAKGVVTMLTPKEKALALCQIFGLLGLTEKQTQFFTLDLSLSQQCAKLAVSKIIESHKDKDGMPLGERDIPIIDYWNEVDKEIDLLKI